MEFKHTIGKWIITSQLTHNGSFFRIKGDTEKVANIVTRDIETANANAKLIACAPEMLEMLDKLIPILKQRMLFETASEVDELVKKATE